MNAPIPMGQSLTTGVTRLKRGPAQAQTECLVVFVRFSGTVMVLTSAHHKAPRVLFEVNPSPVATKEKPSLTGKGGSS